MTVTLCVLLWPREGRQADLISYEDRVVQLLAEHGGQVLLRVRTRDQVDEPLEVHVLQFPSEIALNEYLNDQRRVTLGADGDAAIARSEVFAVDLIPPAEAPW